MIDQIKEKLGAEMSKATEGGEIVRIGSLYDKIIALQNNPDGEKGDPLRWVNVELSLKPEMYLVTGIPSMGKSTWLNNVIVNSISDHDYKWAVYSPESHPIELHMKELIEMHSCTNFYGNYKYNKTTQEQIERFTRKMDKHIFMLNPNEENTKIEGILSIIEYLIINEGVNAFVLDPYNEFSHTRPSSISETEYVSRFLGVIRKFMNKHNVSAWIVAHPTKLKKEDVTFADGSRGLDYPIPTAYDIAGSANFFNKPDVIIAVHRDKDINRNPENIVSVNVQKVRRKTTGKLGSYLLKYNYNDGTYTSF